MAMSTQQGRSTPLLARESIERIHRSLISGFSIAADLACQMGQHTESERLKMRLLSYNTSDTSRLNAEQREVVESIKHIINDVENGRGVLGAMDWETLGLCYLGLGNFPQALAAFNQAIRIAGPASFSFTTIFAMSTVYHHFKLYEQAEPLYQRLIDKCSDETIVRDTLFRLGLLYRSDGRCQQALACFEKVRKAPPNGLKTQDIDFQIAYTLQKLGRNDEAGRMYRDFRMEYPNLLAVTQQYVWFLYLTGMSSTVPAQQRNASLEVAEILKRSLGQFPCDPVLMLQYARVSMKRDDMSTAFGLCKNCLYYWSDSPGFWGFLGILYYRNDQPMDAASAFQRSIFLQTDLVESRMNLAYLMTTYPDFKEKISALDIQTLIGPNTPVPKQIVDIDDAKCFLQIPEQFAQDYVASVPLIKLPRQKSGELNMSVLATIPHTLFDRV